ncbi:hypothetical protein HYH02_000644 [Chlamydomonas schloesseri]|uniref:GS catalytic domain-containing protein n=1 Tax=Chlamydomonas schloesseri TaxID=2026947 RepID=A0A835WVJ6_9CHLO|nr:hypothetical protein HYH02_000644 [Chlamydomonas schloesseri]|eukprot:KAG2454812.1 hypothetical protein HYH02_000644 [Chlamydomonas schloesseri]
MDKLFKTLDPFHIYQDSDKNGDKSQHTSNQRLAAASAERLCANHGRLREQASEPIGGSSEQAAGAAKPPPKALGAPRFTACPSFHEREIPDHVNTVDIGKAKAVRLLWCDTAGIRRCRVIPSKLYTRALTQGVGITTACMAMPAYGDTPVAASGLSAVGEARMVPIECTRVALPWAPGHHVALVEFDSPKSDGPWECCPRRALRNTVKMLEENFGLTMKVGFEIEFLLLEPVPGAGTAAGAAGGAAGAAGGAGGGGAGSGLYGSGWRPVDSKLYCQSSALDRSAAVLDAMVAALEAMGIPVEQWHPESAPGQFEVVLGYTDTVAAADRLLLAKEAIVGVARTHGLDVSFLPKPVRNAAGSGCHMHLSLWKDGVNCMAVTEGGSFSAAAACITAAAAGTFRVPGGAAAKAAGGTAGPSSAGNSNTKLGPAASAPPGSIGAAAAAAAAAASTMGDSDTFYDAPDLDPTSSTIQRAQNLRPEESAAAGPVMKAGAPVPSHEHMQFLAGLLAYLDVLLPFTSPSPNSFARLQPGAWAGAHTAWGYNNREVPLRVTAPGPTRLLDMHLEYKALDGTTNPYIGIAAVMVAGMLGLFAKLVPPEPCQVPPAELDAEAAARLGVKPLPHSLDECLQRLKSTRGGENLMTGLTEALGEPLLQAFLAVREAEASHAGHDLPGDLLLRYT